MPHLYWQVNQSHFRVSTPGSAVWSQDKVLLCVEIDLYVKSKKQYLLNVFKK